ncbi:MAG: hypothetical protein ABI615_06680 [Chthoniobacterales bacterium]
MYLSEYKFWAVILLSIAMGALVAGINIAIFKIWGIGVSPGGSGFITGLVIVGIIPILNKLGWITWMLKIPPKNKSSDPED